jgi:hypothetical protein
MLENLLVEASFCRQDLGEGRILVERFQTQLSCFCVISEHCLWRRDELEASVFKSFCCVEAVMRSIEVLGTVGTTIFPTGMPVGTPGVPIQYST